jgi:hypothetical protein
LIFAAEDQIEIQEDDFSKKAFGADQVVVTTSMGFDEDKPAAGAAGGSDSANDKDVHDSGEVEAHPTAVEAEEDIGTTQPGKAGAGDCGSSCGGGGCCADEASHASAAPQGGKVVALGSLLRKNFHKRA